jgi:hypothetical protein
MRRMKTLVVLSAVSALGLSTFAQTGPAGPAAAPENPVVLNISVAPSAVPAGGEASATVSLVPKPGIKLNKYPKIKIQIPAADGLVSAAEAAIGNAAPPATDKLDENYYHGAVDPLKVSFRLDPKAAPGKHDVAAKVSYFYCVAASGYCAPAKVSVSIPVTVR